MEITRRAFCLAGGLAAAGTLAGCMSTGGTPLAFSPVPQLGTPEREPYTVPMVDMSRIERRYHRQRVAFRSDLEPGAILIDTNRKFLFLIEEDGKAIRYGIGVGRAGMAWEGTARIGRKARWPRWTPTENMMERDPDLRKWAGGMEPGPQNPLGARALYLYENGRDTLYRIHGTNEPWSIGEAMSSGCIRMLNKDVIDLYERVDVGATVVVRHDGAAAGA